MLRKNNHEGNLLIRGAKIHNRDCTNIFVTCLLDTTGEV